MLYVWNFKDRDLPGRKIKQLKSKLIELKMSTKLKKFVSKIEFIQRFVCLFDWTPQKEGLLPHIWDWLR